MNQDIEQKASEISLRIKSLADFDGVSLKEEMAALKQALLENPSACSLLHDEDLGLAVAALRRMVGVAVAAASASKKGEAKPKQKKLTAAELAKLMSEVSDDEFI